MSIFEKFFQALRRAKEANFCPILACDMALESLKVAFQDGIITQVSADIRHIVGARASERIFECFCNILKIIVFSVCLVCADHVPDVRTSLCFL